ncbi:type II secretion system F family protein [Gemmata sp. JC717]|uniref:type II secretion system F family protein n=1 Tax=Gemmata algarum TaxID=2975278 RepID=UPI0021BB9839|nr:type II secretion system F family protein [Gemmata algarum]MDY3554907.1 type II secretion system F family protein [Gemmata algarum]
MMAQLGVFVVVTVCVLIVCWLASGAGAPGRAAFQRRLKREFAGDAVGPGPLYKNLDALSATDAGASAAPPEAGAPAPGRPRRRWEHRAAERLRQAGLPLTPRQFLCAAAGLGAVCGVLGTLFASPAAGAAGALSGLAAPAAVVNVRCKQRREKYGRQIAGAFELMARVLRAGQSVPEAFRAAVESFDDPLAGEFGRCLHQIEHGLRPEAAFRELSERAGILELRIFVVAMAIQRQTGGNLSEVLDRLAGTVRTRLQVRQKVRALTAEGRMQSLTLTVLPALVFAMMYVLNRTYAESLLAQGRLLAGMAACMAAGTLWIRSIMNFEG